MIGVIADPKDLDVVREFFELFKTPWEFYRTGRRYEVLLCSADGQFEGTANLVLCYASSRTHFDDEHKVQTGPQRHDPCILSYWGNRVPIYGDTIGFPGKERGLLSDENSRESVAYVEHSGERMVARIGYDLFSEVRSLLTLGQPVANALVPALELHIALLRDLVTGCGIPLVEIPPVPGGYPFIACLTHDVDHPSIRQQKWNHTIFGFLFRAVFVSLYQFTRGRVPWQNLVTNWAAALKLPFVQVGLAKDFWRDFDDRYLELEKGLCSTFFVIPFKNRSGTTGNGSAPAFRAAQYQAGDLADTIHMLMSAGCEVGLHGIDAWRDSCKGREELEEIRRLTGASEIGVRTHWLYYDHRSPLALEKAEAAYDSTVGYNETVGYRAGTTQAYRPLGASRLLELPLHVMDTALFYPDHLGLSPSEARTFIGQMVDNTVRFGGCLTVNWHDRSIAPERLWDGCYRDIVQDLKERGAWFSTASQAVSWFRKRRAATFEVDHSQPGAARAKLVGNDCGSLPGLRLRIYGARTSPGFDVRGSENYIDLAVDEGVDAPPMFLSHR